MLNPWPTGQVLPGELHYLAFESSQRSENLAIGEWWQRIAAPLLSHFQIWREPRGQDSRALHVRLGARGLSGQCQAERGSVGWHRARPGGTSPNGAEQGGMRPDPGLVHATYLARQAKRLSTTGLYSHLKMVHHLSSFSVGLKS